MKIGGCPRSSCRRRFAHSLSGRLILIFIGMALLFLVLVGGTMGVALRDHFAATVRPHLAQYVEYVQADIGVPPDLARAAALSRRLPLTIRIAGPGVNWSSDGAPAGFADLTELHYVEHNGRRIGYARLGDSEYLVTRNGEFTFAYTIPHERSGWRLAVPLTLLLLILIALYHATRRLFAPIQTIKAGVERFGRGDLDYRIEVRRRDELGDLAASVNAMAADVQGMLDSKRQLLLAISHELRSPLTRARVATSLVEHDAQRDEIERELHDLEKLVEELLETERLASRHQALYRQHTDLGELARAVVDNVRGPRLPVLHLPETAPAADVDATRIKLLLRNLVENALRHTPADAGAPEVTLRRAFDDAGAFELTVCDFGPGIAPEHLPHVTEPFYRVDAARRRETGGYGLGLYLCRRIAEVHGGSLEITSVVPGGTCVTARLPVSG